MTLRLGEARTLTDQGLDLYAVGQDELALPIFCQVFEILKEHLSGAVSIETYLVETGEIQHYMGNAQLNLGLFADASGNFRQSWMNFSRTFGPQHPKTREMLSKLVQTQGQLVNPNE